jgi:hypothetical protein
MAETKTAAKPAEKAILNRYRRITLRKERLEHLVDVLPGTPDPLETGDRDLLAARAQWEALDTRRRNRAVGFVRRGFLSGRHLVRPPRYFSRTPNNTLFDKAHMRAISLPKLVVRVRELPVVALAPRNILPVTPLDALVPRLKKTPIEDLAVILNSRLFQLIYQREQPKHGQTMIPARGGMFLVPMITKKIGEPFREVRDELLEVAAQNSQRLLAMDQVGKIAKSAGVPLSPLRETEGIIREINVPRPLGDVAEVKRRGPVVIFRRGSTIVTTTEEAATYLEFWLQERFDQVKGMSKEELEQFILMPRSTAHVVVVLQHRARIESQLEKGQARAEELQREAEERLYDLYRFGEAEREYLRARFP